MGFFWRTVAPPSARKVYWAMHPVRRAEDRTRRRLYRKRYRK